MHPPHVDPQRDPYRYRSEPTLTGTVGLIGVFAGFLLLLSYPVATVTTVIVGVLGILGIRRHLKTRSPSQNSLNKLRIPGIGTLEYRLTSESN